MSTTAKIESDGRYLHFHDDVWHWVTSRHREADRHEKNDAENPTWEGIVPTPEQLTTYKNLLGRGAAQKLDGTPDNVVPMKKEKKVVNRSERSTKRANSGENPEATRAKYLLETWAFLTEGSRSGQLCP